MKSEKFTITKPISFGRFIKTSALLALMAMWSLSLNAQLNCPLACNDLVQVSMDDDCIVEVTPAMILEGNPSPGCSYVVQVLAPNGQPLPPPPGYTGNNWVTSANIGQTLTTRIWLGTNSCWGQIKIEDKLAPVIDCPADLTVGCWDPAYQAGISLPLPAATDNCGGKPVVTLLSDVITDLDCDAAFRARRVLRYQAKDASGNLSAICEWTITFERSTLAEVRFPKNYDGTPAHRPHLECDGSWIWNPNKSVANIPFPTSNWDKNGNNYPDPEETGGPYINNPGNVSGYINGWQVTGGPAGCTPGTLVFPHQKASFDALGCTLTPFRVDTFYNPILGTNNICKINATYSDTKLDICEKSYKIIRTWNVLDCCSGEILTRVQTIKVYDSKPPVVVCPADVRSDKFTQDPIFIAAFASADPYSCTANWPVLAPKSITDCTSTTWSVKFKKANAFGDDPGSAVPFISQDGTTRVTGTYPNYVIQGLPLGRTFLEYTIKDACGNETRCTTEVQVVDNTPPVAVCDEHTVVTLSNNGWARVFAETFDDGSHDNCTSITFSVRRLTAGCGSNGSTNEAINPFREFIEVCCEDVGKELMVELRVTDEFGNKNSCMVIVNTHDKVPPVITCPEDVTIECGSDTSAVFLGKPVYSATALSTPYYSDNCPNPTLSWRNSGKLDDCGQGVITRTFIVTDNGGRQASCTQTITVRNSNPYTGPTRWPDTKEIVGCVTADTDPSKTGTPTLGAGACSKVAYTYEDQVFPFVDGVCYKILRKWTVIDWCKFYPNTFTSTNPSLPGYSRVSYSESGPEYRYYYPSAPTNNVNSWTYTQAIKVIDNEAPIIKITSKADTDAFGANCDGYVELKNSADDCTPADQLVWSYSIDLDNDGLGSPITGHTNDASGTYPVGTHKITWTVEDKCGNESKVTYTFKVVDKKKPTPYCISILTTVVMPTSGNIDIWARDFDKGSTDNCPTTGCGLKFTFNGFKPPVTNREVLFNSDGRIVGDWPTTNPSLLAGYESGIYQRWLPSSCSSAKLYTCADLGPNTEDMSVWDEAGNTDYCTVTLNVQANGGACSGSRIAGSISNQANEMVEAVNVSLQNMNNNEQRTNVTNAKGEFEFYGMPENAPYKITPEKNVDHLNGVSTLDLVLIQRHILGLAKLSSPYDYMAADANNDKNITASDLSELRKLILGIYPELPQNTSWRFIDKSVKVNDPLNVWNAPQYIHIDNFNADFLSNNFVAVKIGDVNGSASVSEVNKPAETRSSKTLTLVSNDKVYSHGDIVRMNITSDNFNNIAGAQWTMNYNTNALDFVKVESGSIQMNEDNYNVTNGKIAFSWNDFAGKTVQSDVVLFTIEFRAITNNTISNTVQLSSDITKAEAYTQDLSEINLGLTFRSGIADGTFELGQNNPNPFSTSTTISFTLPQAGTATMTIYDITGKVIKTISGQYAKGHNELILNASDFNAHGVMFYELESNGLKSTKKMIHLSK
ncbi:MAG: T9SS type A sorting domain-containing protein [Saprospiraceae bacterium]|nr:MAG: Hyalin repeat-containing protein [Bacteroidetes bacterium OLB9]MCO6464883.1 T9SS type A sorting domain-containing protein [Saprospiraceae bacterium]